MRGGGGLVELNLAGNEMTRSVPSPIFWLSTVLPMIIFNNKVLGANVNFVHLCICFVNLVWYFDRKYNYRYLYTKCCAHGNPRCQYCLEANVKFSTCIEARWAPAVGPWVLTCWISASTLFVWSPQCVVCCVLCAENWKLNSEKCTQSVYTSKWGHI